MIKKLDLIENTDNLYDKNGFITNVACGSATISKVNELIDAVNELQEFADVADKNLAKLMEEATRPENVQDKFAEQRRWIGKLCRFWDDDAFVTSNDWAFGILTSIDKGMQFQYCCNENCNFKHCELVKPDDDIIYRGE